MENNTTTPFYRKLFGMKKGLPIMEEKKNKILQTVICHIISYIRVIPLAAPLAQTRIYANCASGSCLQSSLQLQAVCKENRPKYQLLINISFASLFAAIFN